jgi:hypothetical protein
MVPLLHRTDRLQRPFASHGPCLCQRTRGPQ